MTRDRLCNNPVPSLNGRSCVGTDKDVTACNGDMCPGNYIIRPVDKMKSQGHATLTLYKSLTVNSLL